MGRSQAFHGEAHACRAVRGGVLAGLPQRKRTQNNLYANRGSQFTSRAFRAALRAISAIQRMLGTGQCYDNARMESFFATLKKEKRYKIDTQQIDVAAVKPIILRRIHYDTLRRIYSPNGGYFHCLFSYFI